MTRRRLALYWSATILLVAALLWLRSTQAPTGTTPTQLKLGEPVLPDFAGNDIARIELLSPGHQLTLVRDAGQSWRVQQRGGFPARSKPIFTALRRLATLRIVQTIEAGPKHFDRFQLNPTSWPEEVDDEQAVPLQLKLLTGDGKIAHELIVGSRSDIGGGAVAGRFLRRVGDDSGVYVVDDSFKQWNPHPAFWIRNDLLSLPAPTRIELQAPNEPDFPAWSLKRFSKGDILRLQDARPTDRLNPQAVENLVNALSPITIREVFEPDALSQVWDAKRERRLIIDTPDGIRATLTFTPTGDPTTGESPRLYLLKLKAEALNDEPQAQKAFAKLSSLTQYIYLASRSAIAPLNPPRQAFLEKPREINPGQR